MTKSIEQLRREIDQLDDQIIRLLNQRAKFAVEIGRIKRADGSALHVPSREKDVLNRMTAQNTGPLPDAAVSAIYREIMAASLALERDE
jgi:chorismate mutase/prephenate dehydratase